MHSSWESLRPRAFYSRFLSTEFGLGLSTVICTESSDIMSTTAPELRYLRAFLTGSVSHDEAQGMIQGFQVDSDGAHSR